MDHRRQSESDSSSNACSSVTCTGKKKDGKSLLSEVEGLLEQCALAGGGHAHAERIRRHMLSNLVCLGSHTITRQIATAGRQFQDWTADYRLYSQERLDSKMLFGPIRKTILRHLDADSPVVVSLDDTRLKKSSRKTPGVKYTRDPLGPSFHVNFILAQRFVQLSMAWPNEKGQVRMIPVDLFHAPTPQKPKKNADEKIWKAYRQRRREQVLGRVAQERLWEFRQALDQEHDEQTRRLLTVVDGGYTNRSFLKNLPERTTVIGRIRKDAKLYHLPDHQNEKGRRRIYGPQAPTPEQLRQDPDLPWQIARAYACGKQHSFRIKTLSHLRWRATSDQHNLRLIVIAPLAYRLRKNSKVLYRKPAYLICTDPNLSLQDVLQYYLWRWDIETNFRDEKTLLGVGQAQVHHPDSIERVPALSVAAYALLLTAATRLYGIDGHPEHLTPPKWQRYHPPRASTQNLIAQLRHDLWGQAINYSHFVSTHLTHTNSEKNNPDLASALFYGASVT
jgi:SRSO17 transposase